MNLPNQYKWLEKMNGTKMVLHALNLYGIKEIPGKSSNPVIMLQAKEAGVQQIYDNDDLSWCAVAHTAIALRAGKEVPFTGYARLRAKSFVDFGSPVARGEEMYGDTGIFKRPGGFHVGIIIGEDKNHFHVLGGNQNNSYNITRIAKLRLVACRRPHYKSQPPEVRKIFLEDTGVISTNEQ